MFNSAKLKFDDIFENRLSQEEVREYLLELYERGETAAEIAGAASAMRDHLIPLPISVYLQMKNLDAIFFSAHPDDVELSAAGLLLLSLKQAIKSESLI